MTGGIVYKILDKNFLKDVEGEVSQAMYRIRNFYLLFCIFNMVPPLSTLPKLCLER